MLWDQRTQTPELIVLSICHNVMQQISEKSWTCEHKKKKNLSRNWAPYLRNHLSKLTYFDERTGQSWKKNYISVTLLVHWTIYLRYVAI